MQCTKVVLIMECTIYDDRLALLLRLFTFRSLKLSWLGCTLIVVVFFIKPGRRSSSHTVWIPVVSLLPSISLTVIALVLFFLTSALCHGHDVKQLHDALHVGIGLPKSWPAAYNCGCVKKGIRCKSLLHYKTNKNLADARMADRFSFRPFPSLAQSWSITSHRSRNCVAP